MIKIVEEILPSSLLQRSVPYRVVLPETYQNSGDRYPVLYLLHGLFGDCDNWLELTDLSDRARGRELIFVLPDGGSGWYTNGAVRAEDKYENFFIEELIPRIDARYRTLAEKGKRAVAGLSMGGYGALKFALRRPDLFVFAASMSGAFDAPHRTPEAPGFDWENLGPSILDIFGAAGSPTRIENDLFEIVRRLPADMIGSLPYLYLDCGIDDGFLEINRRLAALLKAENIASEFREVAGGHDWHYWDRELKYILSLAEEKFASM